MKFFPLINIEYTANCSFDKLKLLISEQANLMSIDFDLREALNKNYIEYQIESRYVLLGIGKGALTIGRFGMAPIAIIKYKENKCVFVVTVRSFIENIILFNFVFLCIFISIIYIIYMNKIEGALILSILGIISYISMIITFNTRAVIYLKFIDKILQKTIK